MSPNIYIQEEGLDKFFNQGFEYIKKDRDKAIRFFKKSLKKYPEHLPWMIFLTHHPAHLLTGQDI